MRMSGLALDRTRIRTLFDLTSDVYASRGGTFADDPNPVFHRMRETGPVHRGAPHEALGWTGDVFFQGLPYPQREHFSAYDYETCATVLKDDQRFVTRVETLPDEQPFPDAAILYMNGKEHRDYRTLVQPSFVPARATWWIDRFIRSMVDELIDGFADDAAVDLNLEFCSAIPMLTITGSLGISVEDALDVREAVTSDGQRGDVLARLLLPIIVTRREQPQDDLISVLVQAELTDEEGTVHRLDDVEILAFCFLLLAAGSGTTWKQMGITLTALLRHPAAFSALREDPGFLRNVIEESVRWAPTDPAFARFVAVDTELGGVELPAGAIVHTCLAAANRDPARWERADEFDPFRPLEPHLGFGHGPHTCLGMHVARAEMTYGITALLDRFPDLRLDPDAAEPRIIGLYERGPDAVRVRLRGQ
jgi:cytochrome P450